MLRVLILCLLPLPAFAWTFSPVPICTLDHAGSTASIQVTYDPNTTLYSMHVDRAGGWPEARTLSVTFAGAATFTITTTRHQIAGQRVSVTDRGFGNVLSGLAAGGTATVVLGDVAEVFDLTGAAPQVARFDACPTEGLA
ncbi:hypothetical protein [Jannaschia donghaensis]|uniref:Excinuclease ABC subunit B n=1 Tax=Jannaschia donghaensis TaxID=420998 RepID=A0A0M6YL09_9RHOB|nr:hypothetical protein [Jannaschia donghaensis]CTQ50610.1 hypothetical protein JDO7802_02635 [Jannaschia donghaensis]